MEREYERIDLRDFIVRSLENLRIFREIFTSIPAFRNIFGEFESSETNNSRTALAYYSDTNFYII